MGRPKSQVLNCARKKELEALGSFFLKLGTVRPQEKMPHIPVPGGWQYQAV